MHAKTHRLRCDLDMRRRGATATIASLRLIATGLNALAAFSRMNLLWSLPMACPKTSFVMKFLQAVHLT